MTVRLLENPAEMTAAGTPPAAYAAALAARGTASFVANASSRLLLADVEGHHLPVTVDDGGYGRSYVASPHSAYALYAREELDLVRVTRGRSAARLALGLVGGALRLARANRIVHIDNWLLSTNLHGTWRGEGLAALRRLLAHRFPDHFLALRSLDPWSCPRLLEAARTDGWLLVPARQIWVVDDLSRTWRPRSAWAEDRRALARSRLTVDAEGPLSDEDRRRVAELYAMLYVGKYSSLNPVFTPDFIALTQRCGLIDYHVMRDRDGRIMAVSGMMARDGVMTPPVVGYDTSRPKSEALYRICCFVFSDWAQRRELRLHGSAGAGHFKRLRGARGVIEYVAVHAAHLSAGRRAAFRALAAALETAVVPRMRREGW